MPKINGYQLAQSVQKHSPNTLIQLMSGYDGDLNVASKNQSLHSAQLIKPFKIETLLQRLAELLGSRITLPSESVTLKLIKRIGLLGTKSTDKISTKKEACREHSLCTSALP